MVAEPEYADLARRAAARLAGDLDPNLPALTERVLAEGAEPAPVMRSYDPATSIALAAFILSTAQFAWQIYRDLKEDREEKGKPLSPTRDLLLRRLRLRLGDTAKIDSGRRDRVFEVVVDEVLVRNGDG